MQEEQIEKSRWKKVLLFVLRNFVNVIFAGMILYYAILAFVFEVSPLSNKMMLVGVFCLWLMWILAKSIIKIILAVLLVVALLVGWYHVSHYDEIQCKENGGVWNVQTQICEEKLSFFEKIQRFWKDRTSIKIEHKESLTKAEK